MNAYHGPGDALVGDCVAIEELTMPACIGVYAHERTRRQTIAVSLQIGLPGQLCFRSDRVEDTIDYAAVADALEKLSVSRHFNLIECLAEEMSNTVLGSFGALWIKIRIQKIGVIPNAKCVAVAITRVNARICRLASPKLVSSSEAFEQPGIEALPRSGGAG